MSIVFGLHVFIAHQFGPWITGRTPEDPLVQDSLTPYPRSASFDTDREPQWRVTEAAYVEVWPA